MAVIFINRFFYPDLSATGQLLSDLAFALAGRGRRIHVVTSRLHYEGSQNRPAMAAYEVVAGVEIHRVWTSSFGRVHLLGRAVDYLTFYATSLWRLWRLVQTGDIVVAKTDPPLISAVAMPVCRARRAVLVNWLQDLFPEVAQAQGIGGRWRIGYPPLRWARSLSLRNAAANVVIGRRMANRVEALGLAPDTIRLIPNWADGTCVHPIEHADNPFRRALEAHGAFVVAYSGNLGRVHEIAAILEAIRILELPHDGGTPRPTVRWLFIGGGALMAAVQAEVARRALRDVTFLPYQPRSTLAQTLSAADAHLVCLRPEFEGLIVPSKVAGATAAGRPILFVGDPDGEIGELVARYACGYAVAPGDGAGLARAILELAGNASLAAVMGRRARIAFHAEFDRTTAVAQWRRLLDEVTAGSQVEDPLSPQAKTATCGADR